MAHVRAATDTPSNRTNCHPFNHTRSLFIHNGQIGDYLSIRRNLENLIPDDLFQYRIGTTDSEVIFLYLESLLQEYSFYESTIRMIQAIVDIMEHAKIKEPFRYTSAYSDGEKLYAIRFSTDKHVPTLFYDRTDLGWLLVSEPLDNRLNHWQIVPENHILELSHECNSPELKAILL
ncbi:MAG: class II glutamine amidotransferase, partial [Proteobacteria bacterium]|nr:class II glutamine amidotransferase [Pseudomonadota bacterium]